jgi:hypothetical protein
LFEEENQSILYQLKEEEDLDESQENLENEIRLLPRAWFEIKKNMNKTLFIRHANNKEFENNVWQNKKSLLDEEISLRIKILIDSLERNDND